MATRTAAALFGACLVPLQQAAHGEFTIQSEERRRLAEDWTPSQTSFYHSKFPQTEAEKGSVLTSPWVVINGQAQKLSYKEIVRSGNVYGPSGTIAGATVDKDGKRIVGAQGCCGAHPDTDYMISDMVDFASLLRSRGDDPKKLWAVVHHEDVPAVMQAIELRQEEDGTLTPLDIHNVDWSHSGGVVGTCAGSVSPWNTHLGGEEWGLPDARDYETWTTMDDGSSTVATRGSAGSDEGKAFRYLGFTPGEIDLAELKKVFHPYMNGYPNEVIVDDSGEKPVITGVKHYSMGRYAVELAYCLPTSPQVCYIGDDRSNGVPCAFKPDKENDLSAGRLYCAKVNMTVIPDPASHVGGAGEYDIEWLDFGHATDAQIRAAIDNKTQFSDLFETADFNTSAEDRAGYCPSGFEPINAGAGPECLKLIGDPILASRFETRRYAGMKGATTEWTKMEGVSFDPKRNELYVAMGNIYAAMEDSKYKGVSNTDKDIGGWNAVKAKFNPCGCVYRVALDANNMGTHMKPLICGNYNSFNTGEHFTGSSLDKCDIHNIANPDNIAFMADHDKLLISEDTGYHKNNAIWAYDLNSQSLGRVMTLPHGAEATGVYWHPNINNYAYIMAAVQHPSPDTPYGRNGSVGYIGPIFVGDLDAQEEAELELGSAPAPHGVAWTIAMLSFSVAAALSA
eukprot:TRINITY_DN3367_c1_g1_i1.p1 TRINITY_DN3367_c1_g1~~TRINITY_DN3367_c1_g1_i1.p1  ORF type:complete len:701 (-),score=147.64 TRINITY_DN3367_c1_g1_i1:338-2374(-)